MNITHCTGVADSSRKSRIIRTIRSAEASPAPFGSPTCSDCGDPANPPWEEAMRQYLQFMLDHGVSSGEIQAMTRTLPAWLLGLEDAPKQ